MIFDFRRLLRVLACTLLLGASGEARAEKGDPPEVEAQRLVHVLAYVGADYGGAVEGGIVKNPSEYAEQLSLLDDALKIGGELREAAPAGFDVASRVAKVRALVDAKAPEADVAREVDSVRDAVVGAFKLVEAPAAPPDAAHGQALFRENCATCHGETGRADTPRAASLTPHPSNFHDPAIGDALTAYRVVNTIRFGVNGTAMVPFTFLSDADRWDLAFFVTGLRHTTKPASGSPTYTLAELAVRSDASLRDDLREAGVEAEHIEPVLTDLRTRAPYEDRAAKDPIPIARTKLGRAKIAVAQGDRDAARGYVIDAYLEGVEPAEGALMAADATLVGTLEQRFLSLRSHLAAGAPAAEIDADIDATLQELTRAEAFATREPPSFVSTALSSGGILLREGVEAALLIAALLGIAVQAGLGDKKRLVHAGWISALVLGAITWALSRELVAISGARRELIEGVTALLATLVLFYVSYSLLAKREIARWMKFLRGQVTPRRAGISLFGVAFLAAYREAFETVLFYQALLGSSASSTAAIAGGLGGALALAALVALYSRAGRFAPPQLFFQISSYVLYGLAVVFAGQGIAALQMVGLVSIHELAIPSVPALGLHATIETCAAQGLLLAIAALGAVLVRRAAAPTLAPKAPEAKTGLERAEAPR